MIAERLQTRVIAYEPQFDQRVGLKASYLSRQIDTFLGERLNVLLSKNKYEIKDSLMYGEDMEEPFIDVIKRGVDYRRKVEGEERVDKKREEAEVEGFLEIQEILCNPNTQIGTMMLSVSPQGSKESLYQHNFYDIFTLKEAEGKRFIEARRYSSALDFDEYKDKLKPLSFVENILNDNDADFLSNPIKINDVFFENADQIHSYLHKNHKFIELEEFERIIKTCELLKQRYIRTKDPQILDAIMNKADEAAGLVRFKRSAELRINDEADFYGKQQVRTVAAGCGSSGSVSGDQKSSPFSVSDFGMSDDLGDREFACPVCGHMNKRPYNEKIPRCQNQNCSDPTKVAC